MTYKKKYNTTCKHGESKQALPFFLTQKQWERVERDAKKAGCVRSEILRQILVTWLNEKHPVYERVPQTERVTQVKCPLPVFYRVLTISEAVGLATSTLIKSALRYYMEKENK